MATKKLVFTLLGVVILTLLAGCGFNIAFTPEAAVAKQVTQPSMMPDFQTDPNSVRILQKQPLGKKFVILVAFQGIRASSGRESCMFSYEVEKAPAGGWMTTSGGGGCTNQQIDPETQPIGINGGGGSGGNGSEPGYTQVYGEVFNPKVKTVQVGWSDGQVDNVTPVNSTYFTTRSGQIEWVKVEALDEQGNVIYTFEPNPAPGKQ